MYLAATPLPPSVSRFAAFKNQFTSILTPSPGGALIPGASALPASVGSKLTWKNVGIFAAIGIAAYMAYDFLALPPPRKSSTTAPKPSTAPSPAVAVAGLFGVKYRRRRR